MEDVVTAPVVCDQPEHISRNEVPALLELHRIRWVDTVQKNTLTALRGLVSNGTLTRYEAVDTYNAIADQNGWANVENITSTYTVEVCYQSDVVLTVEGVEADSEEEASNQVLENLEIDNIRLQFDISYGDYADQADVWVYDFDPTDELTAEATEN